MSETTHTMAGNSGLRRRHRRLAAWCTVLVFAMVGAAYAAVPLYRLFCQVTGFDGTPQIATKAPDTVLDKTITVRFDANVAPGFAWRFEPVQNTVTVKVGENALIFYRATNTTDRPLRGTSTYNVLPEAAAVYFNKIQCFCFTEQVLEPGQTVEFPVSFFIDPAIVKDMNARNITHVTLSYTFYPVVPQPGIAEKRTDKAG
jgi:cytochrome c oxidase assembly protein subunit 11